MTHTQKGHLNETGTDRKHTCQETVKLRNQRRHERAGKDHFVCMLGIFHDNETSVIVEMRVILEL